MGIVKEWFKWDRIFKELKKDGVKMQEVKKKYFVAYKNANGEQVCHALGDCFTRPVVDYVDALEYAKRHLIHSKDNEVMIFKHIDTLEISSKNE